MRAITRRQFLSLLMPFRLTATRVALAVRMAAVCGAVALLFSLIKNIGFAASARIALVATLLFVALCLLGGALVWIDSVMRRLPAAVSAAMITFVELIELISVMGYGIYLYRRWHNGEDLTGTFIALALYYVMRFIGERDRRAKQVPKPDLVALAPSALPIKDVAQL